MANAFIGANSDQTATVLLNTDGKTITRLKATNNVLLVSNGTSGSDNGGHHAFFDDNDRTTIFATSSDGNNTLMSLYGDSSGELLITTS